MALDRLDEKWGVLDAKSLNKKLADLGPDAILLCWEKPGEDCHRRAAKARLFCLFKILSTRKIHP